MQILIISDVHANITALEAVLEAAGKYEAVWCLGDLVGYGPDPNECVRRICQLPNLKCIVGNHDAAVLMQIDADTFNPEARSALLWTRKALSEESRSFLQSLHETIIMEEEGVTLTHGSPRHPVWEYLLDARTATVNFEYFNTLLCFVGHTHLPVIYSLKKQGMMASLDIPEPNQTITLTERSIVNPGSVGQPRDRDPRAAFALYDTENKSWDYRRIPYDIQAVQGRMEQAGLPERHILRLSGGW
jgi:predicted phosphodiesterase